MPAGSLNYPFVVVYYFCLPFNCLSYSKMTAWHQHVFTISCAGRAKKKDCAKYYSFAEQETSPFFSLQDLGNIYLPAYLVVYLYHSFLDLELSLAET